MTILIKNQFIHLKLLVSQFSIATTVYTHIYAIIAHNFNKNELKEPSKCERKESFTTL